MSEASVPVSVNMRRRRVLIALGVVALVAVGLVLWISVPVHQKRDVAVPPPDASPAEVVRAYLNAWDARDCETQRELWPDEPKTVSSCRDVASVTHIEVSGPVLLGQGDDLETYVPVHFDLEWRWYHEDVSMVGPTTWGYSLHRETPTAPWRIDGAGVG